MLTVQTKLMLANPKKMVGKHFFLWYNVKNENVNMQILSMFTVFIVLSYCINLLTFAEIKTRFFNNQHLELTF